MKKQRSLSAELLVIIMTGIVAVSALMWIGFSIGMRINADREMERYFSETTEHLRDKINGRFSEYSLLLDFTAIGALPIMLQDQVNTVQLREFYITMEERLEDVQLVFGASTGRWDAPGEFMVFSDGWVPSDPAYDNTTRAWHRDSIAGRGRTIFTDPYIDMITQELVISLVKGVTYQGRTIGMAGADVSLGTLNDYINNLTNMEELRTYIIHPSGMYVTNRDVSLIMEKDFFENNELEDYREQVLSKRDFYSGDGDFIICSMHIPITDWTIVSILP
ncbi:MAG: cache domain-containing protein, partial [Treponema sp.]|nr:cache domain-containing protein [Treponema sp.]